MTHAGDMLISIDGVDVSGDQARVSVLDRGFLFGDSVYEVVRTYDNRPFQLTGHLERLRSSARIVRFPFEPDVAALRRDIVRLLDRWNAEGRGEAQARIVVTRGEGQALIDPRDAQSPRSIVILRSLVTHSDEAYEQGIRAAVVSVRRNLVEALPPAAKTGNYLNNILAILEAQALDADEPILLDFGGRVTESATANVFIVRGNELLTPGAEVGILGGLTRRALVEFAPLHGFSVREAELWPADLEKADEILLTSTTREILPVTSLRVGDAFHPVGAGVPGRAARTLLAEWRRWARENLGE